MIRHPTSAYEEVPYPPPPALAETISKRPNNTAVWVDGDWVFRGSSYSWQRGGWVEPPEKALYALSNVVFAVDGRILFAPATWYADSGEALDRVRPKVPAATPPNEYTSETQTGR